MKSKLYLIVFLVFTSFTIHAQSTKSVAEKLVQEQVDHYNARDIEAFLKPYAEDAELYMFPNELLAKAKKQCGKIILKCFRNFRGCIARLKTEL